jgi:glucosamine--fructose-6-phosphate aminotransferase (isomerizing)
MCGIVGIVSTRQDVAERLIDGLQKLEYRGYDSAGIATILDGTFHKRRAPGKLKELKKLVHSEPLKGTIGIAHTRWATHGKPNLSNTHPHTYDRVTLVHNGIIENYEELRQKLVNDGHKFESDTDTEVIAHLIDSLYNNNVSPLQAVQKALSQIEGAYAFGIMFSDHPEMLIAARKHSPLAVGYGNGEMYIGSDRLALSDLTDRLTYLEEGDVAVLTPDTIIIMDENGLEVQRKIHKASTQDTQVSKETYSHFMEKEIFEQPDVIRRTLAHYMSDDHTSIKLPTLPFDLAFIPKITIVACGTAFYAGMVAKYWFEQIARVPVEIDIASEFRYREPPMPEGGLAIFISQSGETADTIAAQKYAAAQKQYTLGIINVAESSLARLVDATLPTLAGPEIGVASTKAYTTQLTVLLLLAIETAYRRKQISHDTYQNHLLTLQQLPERIQAALGQAKTLREVSQQITPARDVLYLGRGPAYATALEGALKLKEISYIHAEGYAAGEMKHGPIALIDKEVPVIVLAPTDHYFEKTISNMQEVISRGGQVIFMTDKAGMKKVNTDEMTSVLIPDTDALIAPIVYAIPVQLLAYYTATLKGTDVDQPRNLAKSVTVE